MYRYAEVGGRKTWVKGLGLGLETSRNGRIYHTCCCLSMLKGRSCCAASLLLLSDVFFVPNICLTPHILNCHCVVAIAIKPDADVAKELLNNLETTHARCSAMSGKGKGGGIVDKFCFPTRFLVTSNVFSSATYPYQPLRPQRWAWERCVE